jgi:ATP-binding cassette subfamily B protein RaxB
MRVNLLSHLIRLRLPFFEQRHLGDIVSRFQSLAPVQDLFTSGVIVACLDAIVALTTLVVIFLYSPQLAAIALVFLIASVAIQLATFPKSRELSQERIQKAATENSLFLENIRSIRTIKGLAIETRRENAWQDSYVESMNSGFRLAKLNMWVGFWTSLLASMEVIIFLYLGATFVISGTMTLGMLFAFQAYRQQFLSRMGFLTQFGLS